MAPTISRARSFFRGPWFAPAVLLVWLVLWLTHAHEVLDFTPIPNGEGFLGRSRGSLFDREFYFAVRPFVTSLMYKIYGVKGAELMERQVQFSALCWVFLAWVLSLSLEKPFARLLHCLGFPMILTWWGVLGWNFAERSEATAFSFLAVWLGALLLYLRRRSFPRAGFLAIASLLFNFTRDNIPLTVIPTVFLVLAYDVFVHVRARPQTKATRRPFVLALALAGFMCVAAGFQLATIQTAEHRLTKSRHEFPLANIVIRRILPHRERREWFEERGMPVHREILSWKKRWASGNDFAIFRKRRYEEFRLWLRYEGKFTYARYLVTHPDYVLDSLNDARSQLFPQELTVYTGKPQETSLAVRLSGALFPLFTPTLSFLLAVAAAWVSWRRSWGPTLPALSAVVLLTFVSVGAIYHMDAMEVPRHCAMALPLLQVASYALVLLWWERRAPHRSVRDDEELPR